MAQAAQALQTGGLQGGSARELRNVGSPVVVQGTIVHPPPAFPQYEQEPTELLVESSTGKLKRRVAWVAASIAVYTVASSVIQAVSLYASVKVVSDKLEGIREISEDEDVMNVLLRIPDAVVEYSLPGHVMSISIGLLFTLCGCMAAKANNGFCACCFCCCNGCHFVLNLISLIFLSIFMTVAISDMDVKLQEYLADCDPIAVCGQELGSARMVDCIAAGMWPHDYERHFPDTPSLGGKCPPVFLACNSTDGKPMLLPGNIHYIDERNAYGEQPPQHPLEDLRHGGPRLTLEHARRLAMSRHSMLHHSSFSRTSTGAVKRTMPHDPLAQCSVVLARVWHDLRADEPEMVSALRVYVAMRAALMVPLLALAGCGCWFGQELRAKIQVGGWPAGRDQEMMMMVQQPLMVQAPEGVPAHAGQQALPAEIAGAAGQAVPLVLRPPEAPPPPAYPDHE